MKNRSHNYETKLVVAAMVHNGETVKAISEETGIARSTIRKWRDQEDAEWIRACDVVKSEFMLALLPVAVNGIQKAMRNLLTALDSQDSKERLEASKLLLVGMNALPRIASELGLATAKAEGAGSVNGLVLQVNLDQSGAQRSIERKPVVTVEAKAL